MIQVFTPNAEQFARGTAVHLAFRFGMQTAKPFEVSEQIGNEGNPTLSQLKDLEGRNWLTSLAVAFGSKKIELDECIISVNQEKNIVVTALQGRNGTIKEYISDGDYQISVVAAVSSYKEKADDYEASLEYPEDKVRQLTELLQLPETLNVQSDFLDVFGIKSVVVTGFSLEQETHSNRQAFQIQMLSDLPYEIKLRSTEGQ